MNDKGYDNTFSEMDFLFQRKDQGNVTIGDENYFLGENGSWMMDENRKMKNWGGMEKIWGSVELDQL